MTTTTKPAKVAKPKAKTAPKAEKASAPFKMLESTGAINAAIVSIQRRGTKLATDIHQAAVSCLNHAEKHGDVTLATRLVDALPDLTRKNALRDWFLHFGKFTWIEAEGKTPAHFGFANDQVTLLADAIAMPFWQFKPEQAYRPFDLHKALQAIFTGYERAKKKEGEDKLARYAPMIATLKDMDGLLTKTEVTTILPVTPAEQQAHVAEELAREVA